MNCPFCNNEMVPTQHPHFIKDKIEVLTNYCLTCNAAHKDEIMFVYNNFVIIYDLHNLLTIIGDQFEGKLFGAYQYRIYYKTAYNPNEPYPLTPQNVEKRLPFYLVYS